MAFHASRATFDRIVAAIRTHDVEHLGPFDLPDGHTTVNFFDPSGIRLEIVTDWDSADYDTISLIEQRPEVLRVELQILFDDPTVLDELCGIVSGPE